jgi:HlyD family secretion protein
MNVRRSLLALVVAAAPALCTEPGQAPAYRTEKVRRDSVDVVVRAPATVQPEEVVEVAARTASVVTKVHADFNARVEEGTLLAELDDILARAHLEQTRAALRLARAGVDMALIKQGQADRDWKRVLVLLPKGAAPAAEVELARAELDAARTGIELARAEAQLAEANLKEAQAQLDATRVRSPIAGVVIDRRVNVGQAVGGNGPSPSLFLIARDLRRVQVWAAVGETDVPQVRADQPARFKVAAHPKLMFAAKVAQVRLNAIQEKNFVRYPVVLTADNPDGKLLPYLTADVEIVTGQRKALRVPRAALAWSPAAGGAAPLPAATERSVWVLHKGEPQRVKVRQVAVHEDEAEVESANLEEGAEVIVGDK